MTTTASVPEAQSAALALINDGKPIKQALALLRPAVSAPVVSEVVDLPKPFVFSESQIRDLELANSVIQEAAQQTPTTRRMLTDAEVDRLLTEDRILSALEDIIKARKEAQRAAVFNHFDVQLEEAGATEGLLKDDKGHYLTAGQLSIPGFPKKYTREIREGAPSLTTENLEAQIGEDFTRDEFLSLTTPVRYIDEAKITLAIRNKPELLNIISKAAKAGTPTPSFNKRKA